MPGPRFLHRDDLFWSRPVKADALGEEPEMTTTQRKAALDAAAHWAKLADDQECLAAWERECGNYDGAYIARAVTFRNTARALELEASTGKPHCSLCFGPHPNHEHPSPKKGR